MIHFLGIVVFRFDDKDRFTVRCLYRDIEFSLDIVRHDNIPRVVEVFFDELFDSGYAFCDGIEQYDIL